MSVVVPPFIGDITRVARSYEVELAREEARAVAMFESRYGAIADSLGKDLKGIEQLIDDRLAEGKPVPVSWLHRQQRYRTMLVQMRENFDNLQRDFYGYVSASTELQVRKAVQSAEAMLDAAYPSEAIKLSFNRYSENAVNNLVGALRYDSPLAKLTDSLGPAAKNKLESELLAGLTKGLHPNQISKNILNGVEDLTVARAKTITRTEMYRAYREGNRSVYEANDHLLDGWVWFAHLGTHSCAACLAMHGTVHPTNEPMGSHPNCRCTMLPQTKSWSELGFRGLPDERVSDMVGDSDAWLRKQTPELQRAAFGNKKLWKGWRDGEFELQDVVRRVDNPRWGTNRTIGGYQNAVNNRMARLSSGRSTPPTPPLPPPADPYEHLPEWQQNTKRALDKHGATGGEAEIREIGSHIRKQYEVETAAFRDEYRALNAVAQEKKAALDDLRTERIKLQDEFKRTPTYDKQVEIAKRDADLRDRELIARSDYDTARKALSGVQQKAVDTRLKLLKELDPEYGTGQWTGTFYKGSSPHAKDAFVKATDYLPKNWVDDFNASGLQVSTKGLDRAHFYDGYARSANYVEVHTGKKAAAEGYRLNTMVHEMTHFREYRSPRLKMLENEFYTRRTAGEALTHMGPGYGRNEVSRRDKFLDAYIGKDYGGRYFEVATMGVEATVGPSAAYHHINIAADEDFYDFILGILAAGV